MRYYIKKINKYFRYNRKRTIGALFLFLVILGIGLGYSFLNAELGINGVVNASKATWDIHFENIQVKSGSVTPTTEPTISNNISVGFAATLEKPGDFYEFNVDIVNDGTIDAMIDSIQLTPVLTTNQKKYFDYGVTYSDGIELDEKQLLESGKTETIKVYFKYLENADASNYPTSDTDFSCNVTINYVQADNTAIARPSYVYTVNKYDSSVTTPKWNAVQLNQAFPTSITQYQTPSEALSAIATASSLDLPFYLKHKIENGIVTESYVEFVVTPEMAVANTGMVAGTYTLRGEKTYDSDTSTYLVDESYISPYYEANKEAIKTAFGYSTNSSRCSESGTGRSSRFFCAVSGLSAGPFADGYVLVNGHDSSKCYVSPNGASYCNW